MKNGKKHRIGIIAIVVLLATALIADLLCLIPIVGDILGPIYWIIASVYFWRAGIGFNAPRVAASVISTVAELIPGIQELPSIIVCMLVIVVMTRVEDKTGISLQNGLAGALSANSPVNQNIAGSYMARSVTGYDPEGPTHQTVNGQRVRIPDNAGQTPLNIIKENGISIRPPTGE